MKKWAEVISLQGQIPGWGDFIFVFPTPLPARLLSPVFLLPPLVNSFLSPSSCLASAQLFLILIGTHCVPGSKMRKQGHLLLRPNTWLFIREPRSLPAMALSVHLHRGRRGDLHQRGRSMPSCSRAVTWADPTWEPLPSVFHSLLVYRAANALVHGLLLPRTHWEKKKSMRFEFLFPSRVFGKLLQ